MLFQGFINLNKPFGWTSHDCVARVRKLLRLKRVGHAGTLDP
ncbi:MAG: tRNA pseudouridine(55) synthase TruB, partial [Nitrososphaera sp.]|nr:tRNA pseudouridine(55) synthase TruB [Nitrososphaera sp.]